MADTKSKEQLHHDYQKARRRLINTRRAQRIARREGQEFDLRLLEQARQKMQRARKALRDAGEKPEEADM